MEGNACADGVCGRCKINDDNKDHSCKNCNQKLCDYKYEDNQAMMGRTRDNWEGPGPVTWDAGQRDPGRYVRYRLRTYLMVLLTVIQLLFTFGYLLLTF